MEAPIAGTALHPFDCHRQSLQKENQGDSRVVQKIRTHPAPFRAGTGEAKGKCHRAKQSDDESVL
jgi:hypothetical protein